MHKEVVLLDILHARDRRLNERSQHFCYDNIFLITLMLNIPGNEKTNEKYIKVFKEGMFLLKKRLDSLGVKTVEVKENHYNTGSEGVFIVSNEDLDQNSLITIKKELVKLEETHYIGRLLDYDLYINMEKQISRKDIPLESRRCFVCNKKAKDCSRSRRHNIEEILEVIDKSIENYCFNGKH